MAPNITTIKQPQQGILPTPTHKPTRTIRPLDLEEKRANKFCFWCDERFVLGHLCKNKRLYSLCTLKDDEEMGNIEGKADVMEQDLLTPHISLNTLEGTMGCYTLRVPGKVDKHPL